jgi:hypothetical protein
MTTTIRTTTKPSKSIKMIQCEVHGNQMICGCFLNYVEYLEERIKDFENCDKCLPRKKKPKAIKKKNNPCP